MRLTVPLAAMLTFSGCVHAPSSMEADRRQLEQAVAPPPECTFTPEDAKALAAVGQAAGAMANLFIALAQIKWR
jgi:hypothetical protein